jgi:hypothetical protein
MKVKGIEVSALSPFQLLNPQHLATRDLYSFPGSRFEDKFHAHGRALSSRLLVVGPAFPAGTLVLHRSKGGAAFGSIASGCSLQ